MSSTINNRVWQVISGITTIKLYSLENIEVERFKTLNEGYIRRQMAIVKTRGIIWPFFIFIFSLTEMLILLIGGKQVIQQELTLGQLLQFNIMVSHLTIPVLSLGWVMTLIQQGIAAMGRINYILGYAVEKRSDWKLLDKNDDVVFKAKNLQYRYPVNESELARNANASSGASALPERHEHSERDTVLKDLNFTIQAGQIIAVTGTIGSGKTTLINLMSGLYKPARGMLFVNDIDICDIEPSTLLSSISVVPQETFLFSRSIAANIALGTDGLINQEKVKEAVRNAGLSQDIDSFPEGYDQILGGTRNHALRRSKTAHGDRSRPDEKKSDTYFR